MEQTQNIWADAVFTVGGSELTAPELAMIVGALGLALWLWRRSTHERDQRHTETRDLADMLARMSEAQAALSGRLDAMAEHSNANQTALRTTMDQRLDAVSKRLGDGVADAQRRTGDTLRKLHERLALIDQAQSNIKALSSEVSGLQALLSNKQRRGAFGEIQMQDLVKNYLPPDAYEFQATLTNRARADCLIKLPNPPGPVAVDAKFPLDNWRRYSEAGDDAERQGAARAFKADVLKHLKDISEKYLIAGETADSALMFLPSEAVYATLHAEFSDVIDKSFRLRVMVVSPTTFMATLHTMRAVMRDARMREQAGVIQQEVGKLADDVGRLDDRVGKLQRHYDQAGEDMRMIRTSTDKIVRRAERIEEVHVEDQPAEDAAIAPSPQRQRIAAE